MSETLTPEIKYLFSLRDELARATANEFMPISERAALRRRRERGYDILILGMAPHDFDKSEYLFSVSFGRSFDVVDDVRVRMQVDGTIAQIQQFAELLLGLPGVPEDAPAAWIETLSAHPRTLAAEMLEALAPVGEPFFARYTDAKSARDALVAEDPWCIGGSVKWANVLVLDLALGDLDRFRTWSRDFSLPIKQQVEGLVEIYSEAQKGAA